MFGILNIYEESKSINYQN